MDNFINTLKDEFSFEALRDHIGTLLTVVGLDEFFDTIMTWIKFIIIYIILIGLFSELFTCGIKELLYLGTSFLPENIFQKLKIILIIPKIYILIYLKNFRFNNNFQIIFPDILNSMLNTIIPDTFINIIKPVLDPFLYFPFYLGKSSEEKTRLDSQLIPVRNEDYRYLILMIILSYIRF